MKYRLHMLKNRIVYWFKTMTVKKALKLSLFAVLTAALIIVGLFIYRTVINPKAAFSTQATSHASATPPAGPESTPVKTTQPSLRDEFKTDRVNILVLGMDSNTEREDGTREDFRTDTMLLVSIDFDKKRVDMITVPRDSYVTVTNATGKLYKVNSAAYFGGGMCHSGFLNACDTISGVFGGLPVNYYVAVDMDGLKALVDAIGGVYYDVDLNASLDGITLNKGYQLLNGEQVLTYCRLRKGIGNSKDVERQERQQRMLVAVLKTLKQNGKIENIGPIYDSLKDTVYTNLSFEQICALGIFFSGFDDLANINRHVLKGEYHWAYGVYFYLLDQQAKADLVKEIFGEEIEIDKKHDIKYVLANTPPQNTDKNKDKDADPEDAPEPGAKGVKDPEPQTSQSPPANSETPAPLTTENSGDENTSTASS